MSKRNKARGNGGGSKTTGGKGGASRTPVSFGEGAGGRVRPILLLEVNEVPWRLIDRFKADYPNIRRFFDSSRTFTSVTVDTGELSPWITWPSFHRGLSNREHGVQFLGQDPATFKGTPIWEEYRRRGHSIGVCGSLQSWPPVDPGPGGFYIPDTFAHDERCIPRFVEPFQKFNLGQVAKNARVVNASSLFSKDLVPLAASLPRLGIRPKTVARVAAQLARERIDRTACSRRPVFQSLLCWDVFRKLYDPVNPPKFSTFFTNHVAGVMHRYWDNVFPEDFGKEGEPAPYLETMRFALEVTDEILGDVFAMCEKNPDLVVVWAASMGQDTVHRHLEGVELAVTEVGKLMEACGLAAGEYKALLAMVPQIAVEVRDAAKRADVRRALEKAKTASGEKLFRVEESKASLSITILVPKLFDVDAGCFRLGTKTIEWAAGGVSVIRTDPGTAYHIPEGTLAVYGRGVSPSDKRKRVSAADCKRLLLELGGVVAAKPAAAASRKKVS
ncbi:MAG: hypothetical protein HY075_13150 [Deltaproteobacteria bacterium]|nr:hypothetical protein [Deltaproteobacteria bacterium]